MRTLFNPADRAAMITRIERLNTASTRLWGTMSVADMTTHLIEGCKITFNEKPAELVRSKRPPRIVTWLFICTTFPWPKGKLPTSQEYLADSADIAQLDDYKQTLIAYLQRFAQAPESLSFGTHPFFHTLTPAQWGALTYRHIDHHLKQFGC
jgi:hypothetical protein